MVMASLLMARAAAILSIAVAADPDYHPSLTAGIFKHTIAASDPLNTTLPFLMRYFPVSSSGTSCANESCKCGSTGRTELNGTGPGFEPEFGIHSVRAAGVNGTREAASGALSVEDIEAVWTQEIGNMKSKTYTYSPWLDHHLALWAPSLDPYVTRFQADGVAYLRRKWKENGAFFYSILVHAPKTQLVIELISNHTADYRPWPTTEESRHFFQGQEPPATKPGHLWPLHVSRAATNLEEVITFYREVFDASPTIQTSFPDGSRVVVFGGSGVDDFSPRVGLQFVERPAKMSRGRHSTAWFQEYLLNVSKKYMTNYKSCWPVWGDNHIGLGMNKSIKSVISKLDAINSTLYHPFRGVGGGPDGISGPSVVYIVDPTGFQVQLSGSWPAGFLPDADKDNGGFYGYCYTFCEASKKPAFPWVV
jgi:catechol 2,3-dioxygenase-like lactoylglutathione lyase family enzyme